MEKFFLPHLNTQTNSNLSFSFLTISQLVNWASENKLNYLAIADYYPYDIIDFFNLCKEKKIKPIWGVKIFLQENAEKKYLTTIYPQNNKGYKEVIQKLFSPDSPNDRIFSFDYVLSSLSKNSLIVFEAQKLEEINYFAHEWLLTFKKKEINYNNLFIGVNFFLLTTTHSISQDIIPFLLPFSSVKALNNEETKLLGLWKKTNFSRYFFPSDMQGSFLSYLNTEDYFSHCTDDKAFYQLLLIQWQSFLTKPKINFSLSSKKTKKSKKESSLLLLKNKCWQKLVTLKKRDDRYQNVLENELKVIEKLDYAEYFLTFSDVVNHLHQKNIIVGPGRGSATSSLVAYLLGITSIDPLQHNLLFERFLNEKRSSLPDIDLDVENQEEIFKYLQVKYPKKQVARIVTKKKIGWKTAFRETAKLYKIGEIKVGEIISLAGERPDFSNLKLQRWQNNYPNLFELAGKIQDLYYNVGVHPAGITIAEKSLVGLVPLKQENDSLLALFDEDKLARLGLKKYDFLSLKETLSFISEVRNILQTNLPSYQEINLEDKKTWELLKNSLLTGIFQLDTPSARVLFNKFCPKNFSELVLCLALNRPGTRKKVEDISEAKLGEKKIIFSSPIIKETLEETYGFIIFEEQLSKIFAFIYDCSFADAEVKRRELPKKGLEKDFLNKVREKMNFSESRLIYKQISSVIGYTFNKAHAVAYSYLTYYIAYLKANFFPQLIAHFLNKKKEKILPYLQEAFFYGFQIKGVDINYSEEQWLKKDKELIMGFSSLKEYRAEFFQKIVEERKKRGIYKNWEDFFNRTIHCWENIEVSVFEEWVKGNLFGSLEVDIEKLLVNKENIFRYLKIRKRILVTNSNNLPFLDLPKEKSQESKIVSNKRESEALNVYINYFARWKEIKQKKEHEIFSLLDFLKINKEKNNEKEALVNVYAIIQQIEKNNENNYTLVLQDVQSSFKLNVKADFYHANREILAIHNELLFTLKIAVGKKINYLLCKKVVDV